MKSVSITRRQQHASRQKWAGRSQLVVLFIAVLTFGQVAYAQDGFRLPVEESDVQYIEQFERSLTERDWAGAFLLMTELDNTRLLAMAPVGDTPVSAPIGIQINKRMMELVPEGLRSFRLFLDPQAKDAFKAVRQHPNPGSFEQLIELQAVLDLYWATSIGGEASELAGDFYFNQGDFEQAEYNWLRAIEHDQVSDGRVPQLQIRRAIALQRIGDVASIQAIYEGLAGRFDRLLVRLGGEEVDALNLLKSMIETGQNTAEQLPSNTIDKDSPLALPGSGSKVLSHLTFLTEEDRDEIKIDGPATFGDIDEYVPEAVADAEKIYFNWIDTTFAVDRVTGKVCWINGDLRRNIDQLYKRNTSTAGNPRNYNIALAGDVLLTTRPVNPYEGSSPRFEITAIDPRDGKPLWQSSAHADWKLELNTGAFLPMSVSGEVCFHRGAAYVVVHEPLGDAPDKYVVCYLCRFDPNTGEIAWTRYLGNCRPLVFSRNELVYYTEGEYIQRMPQPKLLGNNALLHVLIGEGKLISVNTSNSKIQWALHMNLPYDLQGDNIVPRSENKLRWYYEDRANRNGSDALLLHNGLLYAKQHMGSDLFALDPVSGQVQLTVQGLPLAAKVVAVDDEHFYTMNRVLTCYKKADGQPQPVWDNRESSNQPRHSGVIYEAGQLLTLDGSRLNIINAKNGEVAAVFEDKTHLDPAGGYVYRFEDLLICVGESSITADRLR